MTTTESRLVLIGRNSSKIWGMDNEERARRIARASRLEEVAPGSIGSIYVNLDYAFDPMWFRHIVATSETMLTNGPDLVLANLPTGMSPETADHVRVIDYRDKPLIYNRQLRKLDCPFVERLTAETRRDIERHSYFGAYKGVTDVLTKYLWPELAFHLTRLAARLGLTPNLITSVGAVLCLAATILFAQGSYWTGMVAGFGFMVLDTVDGKLARCTITSSKFGNLFDHGIDLVHPPFWWYFWGVGLSTLGLALPPLIFQIVMAAILAGYVLQRLIEGVFIRVFGIDIHTWRPFDSSFRLITARRNPNMIILFLSLLLGRPELGLIGVAAWTVICLVVHAVRLFQAYWSRNAGTAIRSWMETEP